jgi:hypothetical protein
MFFPASWLLIFDFFYFCNSNLYWIRIQIFGIGFEIGTHSVSGFRSGKKLRFPRSVPVPQHCFHGTGKLWRENGQLFGTSFFLGERDTDSQQWFTIEYLCTVTILHLKKRYEITSSSRPQCDFHYLKILTRVR